jgi:hypothetical protein
MAILGKVPNLLAVVAWVPHWSELLWWPSRHLLLQRRSAVELLLLLIMIELWEVALELWRMARLSHGWHVNRFFGGAPLELPLEAPGMVLFLFFSLDAS